MDKQYPDEAERRRHEEMLAMKEQREREELEYLQSLYDDAAPAEDDDGDESVEAIIRKCDRDSPTDDGGQ